MLNINQYSVLVVIPAYNAGEYLGELIPRCLKYVCNTNLLLVNDGSTDNTLEIIRQHGVKYISFSENRGKGAALMAGFEYAIKEGYRSVLTLDADLQHLPEEIPCFYALDDGHRLIVGMRSISFGIMPLTRWLSNNITSMIVSVFSMQRVRDSQSGFRLIPTEILRSIPLQAVRYDFESEMLFKAGAARITMAEVPISTVYKDSQSYFNPLLDTFLFICQVWKRIWV
ncbi:MAG: glycosyltransferase family 2 protein [Candidatus Zixiibacteriota bacterium]|nr:MAG: glycosyltransferase family 2 protein [candidate division Zixibacteria bacterium]